MYAVYSLSEERVVYASDTLKRSREFVIRRLTADSWNMKHGKYYCPYEIHDIFVHDIVCPCEKCTGEVETE